MQAGQLCAVGSRRRLPTGTLGIALAAPAIDAVVFDNLTGYPASRMETCAASHSPSMPI